MIIDMPIGSLGGEDSVLKFVLELLEKHKCYTFLDAGCGDGKYLRRIKSSRWMEAWGVDAHALSLKKVGNAAFTVHGDMPEVLRTFRDDTFDAVICLDVIEHFEKPQALEVMRELERIARGIVILFTPYGFMPQPPEPENPWQEHKCGFSSMELHYLGYETYVWKDFDYGKGTWDALWGVKEV